MRIDKVHIEAFKNLIDFDCNLHESSSYTVVIGRNALGKSNLFEALVLIFKHLDLGIKAPFGYSMEYECRGNNLKIEAKEGQKNADVFLKKDAETLETMMFAEEADKWTKLSNKKFKDNKNKYLPKNIFAYYSGISNRLEVHFDDHQRKFYGKIIKEDTTWADVEDLRRLFYVRTIHSFFVLLAYFINDDGEAQKGRDFLKEVMGIEEFESVLFVLKKPRWAYQKKGDTSVENFWGAEGIVRELVNHIWDKALAPIADIIKEKIDFRSTKDQELYYLYIKDEDSLRQVCKQYESPLQFFKALESMYISDMIHEVRIKVRKQNVDGTITFKELSEGEQQLLTVIGLLKFNKDEESLVLLDEPDTHLNPRWKWKYKEFLDTVVEKHKTTQIIIGTHDPLVIAPLEKEEVLIFRSRKLENGLNQIYTEMPDVSPAGLGVAGILTSELFELPTTLDPESEHKLIRKRTLQGKIYRGEELNEAEQIEFKQLVEDLQDYYHTTTTDILYNKFIALYTQKQLSEKLDPTPDEQKELDEWAEKILMELLDEQKNSEQSKSV